MPQARGARRGLAAHARSGVRVAVVVLTGCAGRSSPVAGSAAPSPQEETGPEGAEDAAEGCPKVIVDGCAPAPPSWASVDSILVNRCSPCHFPGGVEGAVWNFSNFAHVHALSGSMLDNVLACAMPPPDAGGLPPDERGTLIAWLSCGAPDTR
jgi:hypothetical protein